MDVEPSPNVAGESVPICFHHLHHEEYALAEFAQRLGWPAERVVVIDEDQGQSGNG